MDKMTGILTKLIEKSRDGKITWRATGVRQKFLTMLGGTGVSIGFNSATNMYELQVLDNRGRLIESISARYGLLLSISEKEKQASMKDLHELARRSALNIDSTLDELESHLDAIV